MKIYRHYLKLLVVEKNDTEMPRLDESFDEKEAKNLWDHLLEVFVPESTNQENVEKR
jgi:hypothetical protein